MKVLKWSLPVSMLVALLCLSTVRADHHEKGEKVKVSGIVLLEDGKPAANASVRLMPPMQKKKKAEEQQAGEGEKPARPKPVAETKTDAEGKFSLEAPAGKYRLMANLRGTGSASQDVELTAGKPMENVELKLKPSSKKVPGGEKPAKPTE